MEDRSIDANASRRGVVQNVVNCLVVLSKDIQSKRGRSFESKEKGRKGINPNHIVVDGQKITSG